MLCASARSVRDKKVLSSYPAIFDRLIAISLPNMIKGLKRQYLFLRYEGSSGEEGELRRGRGEILKPYLHKPDPEPALIGL